MTSGTETATVLFTDLVGSTEVRVRIGEEAADELRHDHDELVARAVSEAGGTVVKGLGDGIMATFTSAADAVAAAVAAQQGAHFYAQAHPDRAFSLRIGVSVGDVAWEEGDCFGTPVIEAARLCAAANGGQILCAEVVRILARGRGEHVFEPVGELELKGLADPVPAAMVLWVPAPSPVAGALPMPGLLIAGAVALAGRDDLLAQLAGAWSEAVSGSARAVLLAGEPGIGKTRLAAEAAILAHAQGAVVLYGRCDEALSVPFQPFVEALEGYLGAAERTELRLGRYPGELVRLAPTLKKLVDNLDPPISSDPETEQYRLFDAVASWLIDAAEPSGLVFVLDDLHWAARPTLLLLIHLLHSAESGRVLVLGTYRDTDIDRMHPLSGVLADLRRVQGVVRMSVDGLDESAVIQFMTNVAGYELDEPGLVLAAGIYAETEGNPFFVGEVLRHLIETGAIIRQEDGRWIPGTSLDQLVIPEGVREVVGRRVSRLSDSANRLLGMAAIMGREFDLDVLVQLSEGDEDAAIEGIDEAISARLVEEVGIGQYRFAHALVRQTLYEEQSATRRVRLHLRAGETIESLRPHDVSALAYHFAEAAPGGVERKAIVYLRLAGDRALEALADSEALHLYQSALDIIDDSDDDPPIRVDLLTGVGEAQRRSGQPEFRQTLLEAGRLAAGLGDRERLTRAVLLNNRGFTSIMGAVDEERLELIETALELEGPDDRIERARLLALLAQELQFHSDHERWQRSGDEALAVAERIGDLATTVAVKIACFYSMLTPEKMTRIVDYTAQLVDEADRLGDPQWRIIARVNSSTGLLYNGRLAEAAAMDDQAISQGDELGQPTLRWIARATAVAGVAQQGRLADAEALALEAYAFAEAGAQPDGLNWLAGGLTNPFWHQGRSAEIVQAARDFADQYPAMPAWESSHAMLLVESGRLEEARQLLPVLTGPGGGPSDLMWCANQSVLAILYRRLGEVERARALYEVLTPYKDLEAAWALGTNGPLEGFMGVCATTFGDYERAEAHFSAVAARTEDRPTTRALILSEWVGMLAQRGEAGDRERALELVTELDNLSARYGLVYMAQLAHRYLEGPTSG